MTNESFKVSFSGWDQVPTVFVREIGSGTDTFLHVGVRPIVNFDGTAILVSDFDGNRCIVDLATGKVSPAAWAGAASKGAFGFAARDMVVSWSLPTEGTPIKQTKNNSPLRGPKQMLALKLAKLNTDEFQTIVPYIDPRVVTSFGVVSETGDKDK